MKSLLVAIVATAPMAFVADASASFSRFLVAENIVVARIVDAPAEPGTNEHPPQITIELEEVLRGDLELGRAVVTWGPNQRSAMCGNRPRGEVDRFGSCEIQPPRVGWRMILGVNRREDQLQVAREPRFGYSDKARALFVEAIERQAGMKRQEAKRLAEGRASWAEQAERIDIEPLLRDSDVDVVVLGRFTPHASRPRSARFEVVRPLLGAYDRDDADPLSFHDGYFDGTPGREYILLLRADRTPFGGHYETQYVPAVPFTRFALPATSANLAAVSSSAASPREDPCAIREAFVPYQGLEIPDPFATVNGVAIPASVIHGALSRHMGDIDNATHDVLVTEYTRQYLEGEGFTLDAEAMRKVIRDAYRSKELFLDQLQRRGHSSAYGCWEKREALLDRRMRAGRAPDDVSRRIDAVREASVTQIFYEGVGSRVRRWARGDTRQYSPWELDGTQIVDIVPVNTSVSTMYQVRYANGAVRMIASRPPSELLERLRSKRTGRP